jgi:Tol biopolymer transport system component
MNGFIRISILFLLILSLAGQTSFAQTAEELMPKAIQLEEVKGELEKAIEVYQTIINSYPDNKPVAAKAYFHMGMCYEKLGKQEAKNAYYQLIQNYADQIDLVARARTRLAIMDQPAGTGLKEEMLVRKVWSDSEVDTEGEISPDGRYISYVDWITGNLAIYEVATGKKRRVTQNGSWEDTCQWVEFSRWSPDGKQLVYCWYNDYNPSWIDLYVVGMDGSEPRKLWSDREMDWTQCYDWSPDGKYILVCCLKKDHSMHIGLVSVADGSLRLLKELTGGQEWTPWPRNMGFSPDSHFIVYDVPPDKENPVRDIFLLSIDGGMDVPLVEHPANDYVLGWSPGGRELLFASDRNGTLGAWIIPCEGAGTSGEAELVKQDIGQALPIGFSNNGSYYFGIQQRMQNIYAVDLNPGTGKVAGPAQKIIRQFEGYNEAPAYSPDGKYIAYISCRSPMIKPFGAGVRGGNVLCIKSLETGKVIEINPSLHQIGYPSWSPDGSSIAIVHWISNDRIELCNIDVQTGHFSVISKPDKNFVHFGGHGWSPDGRTFYFGLRTKEADSWNLIVRDIESGKEETIYKSGDFYTFAISPDGRWLAITCPSHEDPKMKIISTTGKDSRILYNFEKGVRLGSVPSTAWTTDGNYILFGMSEYPKVGETSTTEPINSDNVELCRIPVSGGEPEKLGLKMNSGFVNMSMHPDGRKITFSCQDQSVSEIWVMENFLPEFGTR